ncbi:MAG: CDP-alcohol phosphatidyltransferase family protein [Gammaproteobacteria bacterium]
MRLRDIPNLLCILRMFLAAPVAWMILEGNYDVALALFFVAGFTDGLDGFLAKRFHWQTELGGMLDPIADKLLIFSAFVCLWVVGLVPLWLLLVVVGRDVMIVSGAVAYRVLVGPFEASPTLISKLNSAVQLLFVLLALTYLALGQPPRPLLTGLALIILLTTVISGTDYVINWARRARVIGR